MAARLLRIAVLGGDGRFRASRLPGAQVTVYKARRYGGNGALRRLLDSIRAGGVDRVIVLTRWNDHSGTGHLRALCATLGIPVELWQS